MKFRAAGFAGLFAGVGVLLLITFALGCRNKGDTANPPVEQKASPSTPEATATPAMDGPTAEALAQIRLKLAAIDDYSMVYQDFFITPEGVIARRDLRYFKRPNLFSTSQTQVAHVAPELVGSVYTKVCDGETFWDHVQRALGSGQHMAPRLRTLPGMTTQRLQESIQRHEQPQLFRYDLQQFKEAGFSAEWEMGRAGILLRPFEALQCNMDTLELTGDDGQCWTFTTKLKSINPTEFGRIRMTFAKETGAIQEAVITNPDGSALATLTFSDIKVNPGLADELFIYTPPPGLEAMDRTAEIIKKLTEK